MVPEKTMRAVIARSGGFCESCGVKASLQMHHLYYEVIINGEIVSIHGIETPEDMLGLCHDCHRARHRDPNGDYWLEEQEKDSYWYGFEKELGE